MLSFLRTVLLLLSPSTRINSGWLILPSPLSTSLNLCKSSCFTKPMSVALRCSSCTRETTSHNTPMSICKTKSAESRVYDVKAMPAMRGPNSLLNIRCVMTADAPSSNNVPSITRTHIARGRVRKSTSNSLLRSLLMSSLSFISMCNNIAQIYTMSAINIKEEAIARNARNKPLTIVTSSGNARIKRAMRVSFKSRMIRRGCVGTLTAPFPKTIFKKGISTHTSSTIVATRNVSNLNQPSLQQSLFFSKARRRMNHSKEKYTTKN
mmetsp:Transcript_114616/g.180445  ORF Transcript_114616/g.180445 Transcript_114616/m.180445 type:complete len:265 (+) Transcript_114616:308-1102(+)